MASFYRAKLELSFPPSCQENFVPHTVVVDVTQNHRSLSPSRQVRKDLRDDVVCEKTTC